jgi:hypothetical protein
MQAKSLSLSCNAAFGQQMYHLISLESGEFSTSSLIHPLVPRRIHAADQLQRSWDAGVINVFEKPQDYSAMDDATCRMLTDFIEPYNQQL